MLATSDVMLFIPIGWGAIPAMLDGDCCSAVGRTAMHKGNHVLRPLTLALVTRWLLLYSHAFLDQSVELLGNELRLMPKAITIEP